MWSEGQLPRVTAFACPLGFFSLSNPLEYASRAAVSCMAIASFPLKITKSWKKAQTKKKTNRHKKASSFSKVLKIDPRSGTHRRFGSDGSWFIVFPLKLLSRFKRRKSFVFKVLFELI